ncbi:DUF4348 domain-containing protein [Flagellimonas pacifica]|nr:DUF4348 domain-containing protein [Allomuricauda parva]
MFVLIILGVFSCKREPRNKEAYSNTIESPVLSEKVDNHKEEKEKIIKPIEMAKDCNQTFDAFFKRFATDSVFQKNRVKYPMEWYFYGNANYASLDKEIINSKDKFRYFDFTQDKKAIEREYGAFKIEKAKHKDSVIYKRIGLDSGLLMNFKFHLVDGCWYMVEILDEST